MHCIDKIKLHLFPLFGFKFVFTSRLPNCSLYDSQHNTATTDGIGGSKLFENGTSRWNYITQLSFYIQWQDNFGIVIRPAAC